MVAHNVKDSIQTRPYDIETAYVSHLNNKLHHRAYNVEHGRVCLNYTHTKTQPRLGNKSVGLPSQLVNNSPEDAHHLYNENIHSTQL